MLVAHLCIVIDANSLMEKDVRTRETGIKYILMIDGSTAYNNKLENTVAEIFSLLVYFISQGFSVTMILTLKI